MIFGGMQRSSTIDFPGALACVLFTRGCDLDCFYCHNRELIAGDGGQLAEAAVFSFLEKRRGLLDGVVVSGGEPTLQPDLEEFLRRVRPLGYRVKLDTNGRRPALVERLWREGLFDYVAVDVKALPADYPAVCGADRFSDVRLTIDAPLAAQLLPHARRLPSRGRNAPPASRAHPAVGRGGAAEAARRAAQPASRRLNPKQRQPRNHLVPGLPFRAAVRGRRPCAD